MLTYTTLSIPFGTFTERYSLRCKKTLFMRLKVEIHPCRLRYIEEAIDIFEKKKNFKNKFKYILNKLLINVLIIT